MRLRDPLMAAGPLIVRAAQLFTAYTLLRWCWGRSV